jgi:hypothetical protein
MNSKRISTAIAVIGIVALTGCTINVPAINVSTYKTGATQTEKVSVPVPADQTKVWDVELSPAAATIDIKPGEGLVQGTVDYNVPELKPQVTTSDGNVTVREPNIKGSLPKGTVNDWNFTLGAGVPMNLTVNTGASKGDYDFGGLSLHRLKWAQGAADAMVQFSAANPEAMEDFRFDVGASKVTMSGLANANFSSGRGTIGAGSLILYFDGQLKQDVNLTLEGGAASITIYTGGNPVRATMGGALSGTKADDGWARNDKEYTSPEWASATGPKITIKVTLGAGSLTLKTGK